MHLLNHTFNVLNGVSRERFTDLKLITECGQVLPVHKIIITAVSSFISRRLSKKDTSEMIVRNVKFSSLKNMVDFIYTRKVVLNSYEELQDFAATYKVLIIDLGPKVNDLVRRVDNAATSDEVDNSSQEFIQLKCVNCDKQFDDKTKLKRHAREVHSKDRGKKRPSYVCEKCREIYKVII